MLPGAEMGKKQKQTLRADNSCPIIRTPSCVTYGVLCLVRGREGGECWEEVDDESYRLLQSNQHKPPPSLTLTSELSKFGLKPESFK